MSSMDTQVSRRLLRATTAILPAILLTVPTGGALNAMSNGPVAWSTPAELRDTTGGNVDRAMSKWRQLRSLNSTSFDDYASFLMHYPGWPDEAKMRARAEKVVNPDITAANALVTYFDKFPPITNSGHAAYAVALQRMGSTEKAMEHARKAWRGGDLAGIESARIDAMFGDRFSPADNDARIDALLWDGEPTEAASLLSRASASKRGTFEAAIAMRTRASDASTLYAMAPSGSMSEASFVAERARYLIRSGNMSSARALLAGRPPLTVRPGDAEEWYEILLNAAQSAEKVGNYTQAYQIASRLDDALPPGTDVSKEPLGVRDDYTSNAWLAGRLALEKLGRPRDAVKMFAAYGDAAKTPQTSSKGYYWAAKAAEAAGDTQLANQWYERTAEYHDHFYGMLAIEKLHRALPAIARSDAGLRGARVSTSDPLYSAAQRAGARGSRSEQTLFLRAVADGAKDAQSFREAVQLSAELNRPDLAVDAGRTARIAGLGDYIGDGFPTVDVPARYRTNHNLIHAIARQESMFDLSAVSHAGARGLMQLMPGTARDTARKLGVAYSIGRLTTDPDYNIAMGNSVIEQNLRYYKGSWPLAIAAYNAGPGNVNKWLRANGDPRRTGDWLRWIEDIPFYETKNYVQRVLENLAVYDRLHPESARYTGDAPISYYLGR